MEARLTEGLNTVGSPVHQREFSRRGFLMLSGALAGSALLAACGGDDDDEEDPTATTSDATVEATNTPQPTLVPAGAGTPTEGSGGEAPTATEGVEEATAAPTEVEAEGTKIFRTAYGPDIVSMDPAQSTGIPEFQLGEAIYSFLARYAYDPPLSTEIVPDLAETWEISGDGSTYTFNLRQGVQFHRGYGELKAADILWNWERIKAEETGSRYATDFQGSTIEAVDDYTLRVAFEFPYPAFIPASVAFVPGLIISPVAFDELGEDWKTNPVGTGAFQWGEWMPGSFVRLTKNPDYFGTPAKVDEIFCRVRVDERTSVLSVSTGELDAFYVTSSDVALDASSNTPPNTTFIGSESGQSPFWLAFNLTRPPLDDVRVRHALRLAIDEQLIADELFGGLAEPLYSCLPSYMFGFCDVDMKFEYDPEAAMALLAEANVPGDWKPVLLGDAGQVISNIIVEAIGSFWRDIGVDVQIDEAERGIFLERRFAFDFDVFAIGVGRIEPDQIATPYWKSGSTVNQAQYAAVDDLIDQAKSEVDVAKRAELYCELQNKLAEDSPAAFIVATSTHLVVNERVSGISGVGWQLRFDWSGIDVPAE